MRYFPISIFLFIFLWSCKFTIAQEKVWNNQRSNNYIITADTLTFDSLSIIPGSVIVEDEEGNLIDYRQYSIDHSKSMLIWFYKPSSPSVSISYKVLPYDLDKRYYYKDPQLIEKAYVAEENPFIYIPGQQNRRLSNIGGLDYNGSFSRGISFGNSQDLAVNSSFNLQLSGKLNNDVDITAALTDNNIPIQPEGNTQQIQDFDNVYIQLSKDETSLIIGDFQITKPESYFMNYQKKTQGLGFSTIANLNDESKLGVKSELGVSRGKWARNQFIAEEGNQGPYRLTGNNGETFIIILSGTERVYIDGVRMVRGAENDYVIDYNMGEVTFMPRQLITKDKRISIEFQYSEQSYLRTLAHVTTAYEAEKYQVKFNVYSEQDAKNQSINRELSDEDKLAIALAGSNQPFVSGVDAVEFDPERILYKRIDSLGFDSVFVYSTDPDSAQFNLSFSFVGKGNGDYVIAQNNANGRVYQWVSPTASGLSNGEYDPVVLLVAPNRQQMYTLGLDRNIATNGKLQTELALSNNDVNTFSSLNDKNQQGVGVNINYLNKHELPSSKSFFTTLGTYEFKGADFDIIERYRPVEFVRDWNIINPDDTLDEHIITGALGFNDLRHINVNYELSSYLRGNQYSGFRHGTNSTFKWKTFQLLTYGSYLHSEEIDRKTNFFRPRLDLSKRMIEKKPWVIGTYYEEETNKIFISDTLSSNSFKYNVYKVYVNNGDTADNAFGIEALKRIDHIPLGDNYKVSTEANSINILGALERNINHQFRYNVSYRELLVKDTNALNAEENERTILGRLEYFFIIKKGFIRSNTLYELGSGQERRRDFEFIPVAVDGTGTHYWEDFNEDGIDQKNEYVLAVLPGQGTHIKQFTFTTEFIKTNKVRFNELLNINPKVLLFNQKTGWKSFVARLSAQSSLQLDKQVLADGQLVFVNPFAADIDDSVLISNTTNIRNSLYFNRISGNIGLEITKLDNQSRLILINGLDTRRKSEYLIRSRWNISQSVTINVDYIDGERSSLSELFTTGNYLINNKEVKPAISYINESKYRIGLSYSYLHNINAAEYGGGQNINNKLTADLRYNIVGKSSLNISTSYIKINTINFEEIKNTPVSYAMLEGLREGTNVLWSISYERTLGENVQMEIGYNGRRTGADNPLIHTGRAQIRAIF